MYQPQWRGNSGCSSDCRNLYFHFCEDILSNSCCSRFSSTGLRTEPGFCALPAQLCCKCSQLFVTCSLTGAQTCPKLPSGASEAVHQCLLSLLNHIVLTFKSSRVSLGCPLTKDMPPFSEMSVPSKLQRWVTSCYLLKINKIQVAFLGMYFVHSAFQDQILLQWKGKGINEAGYNSHPSN